MHAASIHARSSVESEAAYQLARRGANWRAANGAYVCLFPWGTYLGIDDDVDDDVMMG